MNVPAQRDMRIGDVLGLRFLAKVNTIHELTVTQSQITLHPIPILQRQFRHNRAQLTMHFKPDTRLASVNPVILSKGCFDHCCPLDFTSQFELKEGGRETRTVQRSLSRSDSTCLTLLSTSKLRKHGFSVVLDRQQTIQKGGTTTELADQNGLPTLELRLAS